MPLISNFTGLLKKHSKICLFVSLCIVFFIFIKIFHHTLPLPAKKWIDTNLENIQVKDPADFSFAVFGGTKVSRLVFGGLLEQVDHDPDIAFTVDLGDAVLKGRKPNYHYFIKQIDSNLGIPLLPVIGDNELSGEGRDLYSKIFGPFYYSFRIGSSCFIVLDNAGENGPDNEQLEWLENELKVSGDYDNRFIFLHRPFYDPDRIKTSQSMPEEITLKLIDLFRKYHVSHIFASQVNGFFEGDFKGVPYTLTGGAGRGFHGKHWNQGFFHFLKVNVRKNNIDVEFKKEFSPGFYKKKYVKYGTIAFGDHILRVHWMELSVITLILLTGVFFLLRIRKNAKKS